MGKIPTSTNFICLIFIEYKVHICTFYFCLLEEECEGGKVNVHHRNNAPDLLLNVVYTFTWIEQGSVPPDMSSLFWLLWSHPAGPFYPQQVVFLSMLDTPEQLFLYHCFPGFKNVPWALFGLLYWLRHGINYDICP